MICESPLEVTFCFKCTLLYIPVTVSKRIAKAIKIRIPEIGKKNENTIDVIWREFSFSLVSNIYNCVFILQVVLLYYKLNKLIETYHLVLRIFPFLL